MTYEYARERAQLAARVSRKNWTILRWRGTDDYGYWAEDHTQNDPPCFYHMAICATVEPNGTVTPA